MRKIFTSLVTLLLLIFFAPYFLTESSLALASACTVTFDPPEVNNKYNADILIQMTPSASCVFMPSVKYYVFFCPSIAAVDSVKCKAPENPAKTDPSDQKKLTAPLNLLDSARGKNNPGRWYATICTSRPTSDCQKTIIATGNITVGSDPTPVPPSDLPKIDALAQAKCSFKIGDSVTLIATNIIPDGRAYQWWWNGGDVEGNFIPTEDFLTFTIPPEKTLKVGVRNVCVEDKIGSRTTGQSQNCISLVFYPGTPPGDTKCTQANSGTALFQQPDSKDSVPDTLPPCAEDLVNGKCPSINSAIGNIPTNPAKFVQFIYSVVLGLAGGIALVLIIIAGYKTMTSGGNPEATKSANEGLTSAVIGLLFIIFAFVILQIVGVDILRIPGFSK